MSKLRLRRDAGRNKRGLSFTLGSTVLGSQACKDERIYNKRIRIDSSTVKG